MTNVTVARNILQQLGGHRFSAMTGSNAFAGDDMFLTFKIGHNEPGWTHCKITLTAMDDYIVTFYKLRKSSIVKTKDIEGVYCDMLSDVFTSVTGLDTSL